MKKAVCLIALVLCFITSCAGADSPAGVIADFTDAENVVLGENTWNYNRIYFDYDQDGQDELIILAGYNREDGTRPVSVTFRVGPTLADVSYSPPRWFKDVQEILFVGFIDIDPDDGSRDLVVSVRAVDGSDQSLFAQGILENTGDGFGKMWADPKGNKILDGAFYGFADGIVYLGNIKYTADEKYTLKESGTFTPEEVPTAAPSPVPTPAPTAEPTGAPTAVPTDAPTAVPAPTQAAPAPSGSGAIPTQTLYRATAIVMPEREIPTNMDYSFMLRDDGTFDFTMSGSPVPGLTWRADGDDAVADYFGAGEIRLTPDGNSVLLSLMGSLTLRMVPAE